MLDFEDYLNGRHWVVADSIDIERTLYGLHWLTTDRTKIKYLEHAFLTLSVSDVRTLRKAVVEYLSGDTVSALSADEARLETYLRNIDVAVLIEIMTGGLASMGTNPISFGSWPTGQANPWRFIDSRLRVSTWAVPEDVELEYDALAKFDHWIRIE